MARRIAPLALIPAAALVCVAALGCGQQYRPVVSAVNPVGPAAQPTKYAVAIASTGPTTPGLVNIVDFSGDTTLVTAQLGADPQYLILNSGGSVGYTLNGDGSLNTFGVSTSLITSDVTQQTVLPGAAPVAILPQTTNLYVAEMGLNSVAQFTQTSPPTFHQQLPTGPGTVYTVGVSSAPRVYALAQGAAAGSRGTAAAIETASNTISATLPVGVLPVYGVMTADARRAFIMNKGDGTVSVINAQANAPDSFVLSPTGVIPVGTAPVWADFAPTLAEMLVVNEGSGTGNGTVSVINIPLCSSTTVTSNPNCDVNDPVDAASFGQTLATIPVGINPVMIAVLQDGTQAYVANAGNAVNPGSVSVIDLLTDTVVATLPAGASTNEADALVHGHPSFIAATTGDPTGKVYVTSSDSSDLTIIRTDIDTVETHLPLQGMGVQVRVTLP